MRPPAGRFKPRHDRYFLLVGIVWVGSLFLRLVDSPLQLAPAISFFTRYDRYLLVGIASVGSLLLLVVGAPLQLAP